MMKLQIKTYITDKLCHKGSTKRLWGGGGGGGGGGRMCVQKKSDYAKPCH